MCKSNDDNNTLPSHDSKWQNPNHNNWLSSPNADSIEDPALITRSTPKTSVKIQRRPLVSLKDDARDQNPSATNEEERKRQSKKYSSSIKQNQLEELTSKGQETTTAGSTTAEGELEF